MTVPSPAWAVTVPPGRQLSAAVNTALPRYDARQALELRLGAKMREENDLADRRHAGQQHRQPVDADAEAAGGGQAVLEGAEVVLVDAAGPPRRRRRPAPPGPRTGRAGRRGRSARRRRWPAPGRRRSARSGPRASGRRGAGGPAARPRPGSRRRTIGPTMASSVRLLVELEDELARPPVRPRSGRRASSQSGSAARRPDGRGGRRRRRARRPGPRSVRRGHGGVRSTAPVEAVDGRSSPVRLPGGARPPVLGEGHHVGVVGERLVGLEHRELGVVAGVMPSLRKTRPISKTRS